MADVDASVPDRDWLAKYIPLPYRVAILVNLGIYAWGVNLRQLRASGIVSGHHTLRLWTMNCTGSYRKVARAGRHWNEAPANDIG